MNLQRVITMDIDYNIPLHTPYVLDDKQNQMSIICIPILEHNPIRIPINSITMTLNILMLIISLRLYPSLLRICLAYVYTFCE